MKELCENFNRKVSTDLGIYNEVEWFNGVLETIKGSSRNDKNFDYNKLKNKNISSSVYGILNTFPDNENNIDDWYKKSIQKLHNNENLTIGRSQKLINLLVKYYVSNFYLDDKKNELSRRLNKKLHLLHIPIDSIVLKNTNLLFRDTDNSLKNILSSTHYIKTTKNDSCWSKLDEYDTYLDFQKYIRELSNKYMMTPIEFEMRFLWKSEKDLIKHYFDCKLL